MSPAQRRRLLAAVPLEKFTANTLTNFDQLEQELERVKQQGFAFDEEEFLPGLLCLGILIPSPSGASNMGLAIQAPMMRFSKERALSALPALRRAAEAITKINSDLPIDQDNDREFQAA
jgi:DNA-binding IclR family transcriptional regulator